MKKIKKLEFDTVIITTDVNNISKKQMKNVYNYLSGKINDLYSVINILDNYVYFNIPKKNCMGTSYRTFQTKFDYLIYDMYVDVDHIVLMFDTTTLLTIT